MMEKELKKADGDGRVVGKGPEGADGDGRVVGKGPEGADGVGRAVGKGPEGADGVGRAVGEGPEGGYEIRRATVQDAAAAAALAVQMWQGHKAEELQEDFREILQSGKAAVYLQYKGEKAVGFAQCQLRRDYVEGTETSPVGYLEGVFVEEAYRRQGCAGKLLAACEAWAREQGCTEFASDCELDNEDSLKFHLSAGFREANRIICFAKRL